MSKSRGNVINPDTVVAEYGADSLRLYEMFMGPLEAVKPWSMKGVEGVYRFLGRAWRMIVDAETDEIRLDPKVQDVELTREQAAIVARTVAGVTDDLEAMRFNTAISKLMEFTNDFTGDGRPARSRRWRRSSCCSRRWPRTLAEEMWEILGHDRDAGLSPVADVRPGPAEGRHDRGARPGQRQAPRRGSSCPSDADESSPGSRRAGRREGRGDAGGEGGEEGDRGAGGSS